MISKHQERELEVFENTSSYYNELTDEEWELYKSYNPTSRYALVESKIKEWRQQRLKEDTEVVNRVVNAPERQVFKVETGTAPLHEVKQKLAFALEFKALCKKYELSTIEAILAASFSENNISGVEIEEIKAATEKGKALIGLNIEVGNIPNEDVGPYVEEVLKSIELDTLIEECNVRFLVFPVRSGFGCNAYKIV